jgi:RNA recognition motif-containing protein
MNLYVSNIAYEIKEYDLREMFAPYGPTKVVLVKDRFTGKSRGYGFVEFSDDEVGKKVIKHFHGKDFYGKLMNVAVAKPRSKDNNSNKKGKKGKKDNTKIYQFDK